MKKLIKALAVLAAVAALGFGFVSCSDGGSSSDDSKKTDTTKTDMDSDPYTPSVTSPFVPNTGINTTFANSENYKKWIIEDIEKGRENSGVGFNQARINFYDDGTYIVYKYTCFFLKANGKVNKTRQSIVPLQKGTYTLTGDFTNGTVNFERTHNFPENVDREEDWEKKYIWVALTKEEKSEMDKLDFLKSSTISEGAIKMYHLGNSAYDNFIKL